MKKCSYILSFLLLLSIFALAGEDYLVDENVAVFYPNDYKAVYTQPSVIFSKEIKHIKSVPSSWKIKPIFKKIDGTTVAEITFNEPIDFYGNGEVIGPLLRNNSSVELWNTDNYCYQKDNGRRLYQSHPWIMGVRNDGTTVGVIADNTWKQEFIISDNKVSINSEGPSFRVFIFESENPTQMMNLLGEWTGTMEMPPLWALGYHQCRYSYYPDTEVMRIANEFRARKIPCDVIWMDIDYMDKFKVFTFDKNTFPNPKKLNNFLHKNNFKSVYMIDPGVKKENGYFVYDSGSKGNHWVLDVNRNEYNGDVWPGACAFPDFTRNETCKWWANLYSDFMSYGIDGVWNDMNEPAVFDGPDGTMPFDNFHRGDNFFPSSSHLRYHNIYGMLMVKASREGILSAKPDKRPFVLSRANFLGGQRYAATWTGDNKSSWDHLKLSIPMSLSLSLSGQPFNGPDIGGFEGNCSSELLAHWMALGAYYPFSRNHASKNSINQEPWVFGKKVEDISRTAINRRYKLLPYLYSLFRESSLTGIPIMQPVFFADPKDLSLRSEEQAFLLGENLLVVPRWASNVDLPYGDWDHFFLEEKDDGYQPILFLKPGSILPIGNIFQHTDDYNTDKITLLVNPSSDGTAYGQLYHDEGDGFDYKNNKFSLTGFNAKINEKGTLKINIDNIAGDTKYLRKYRIGYVYDGKIIYSKWFSENEHEVTVKEHESVTIDSTLFPSMYLSMKSSNKNKIIPMKYLNDGRWLTDPLMFDDPSVEFFFSDSKDSNRNVWGNQIGLKGEVKIVNNREAGIRFKVTDQKYIISFNEHNLRYKVIPAPKFDYISIVGDATSIGWNPAGIPFEQNPLNPNIFLWTGNLKKGSFKFHTCSGNWNEGFWIHPKENNQSFKENTFTIAKDGEGLDNKWLISKEGVYDISINLLSNEIIINSKN